MIYRAFVSKKVEWEENPRAINFYKKNGYVEFDKHIFMLGEDEQTDIDEVMMEGLNCVKDTKVKCVGTEHRSGAKTVVA